MKARPTKPAEHALGWLGFLLALPALLPIAGVTAWLARLSKSQTPWKRALSKVWVIVLLPLFLIAVIVFVPYYALLQLLAALGLVRRELPPMLVVVSVGPHSRIDLSVPQSKPELAEEIVSDLSKRADAVGVHMEVVRMDDEGRISAEISLDGDSAETLCRSFIDAMEEEESPVEVHYAR